VDNGSRRVLDLSESAKREGDPLATLRTPGVAQIEESVWWKGKMAQLQEWGGEEVG